MKRLIALTILLLVTAVLSACGGGGVTATHPPSTTTWMHPTTAMPSYTQPPTISGYPPITYPPTTGGTIGLAPGGAKDVGNFRENIRNDYLPLPTDLTYEGLFYDYFFDTGQVEPANKLFSPSYSYAVSRDPFSHQIDYYLSVGLNSGVKESDFERKRLNLVIVLDTSGSMSERYNQYYYDATGNQMDAYANEGVYRQSKMDSAIESVISILHQLRDGDSVAVVTFNSQAFINLPMSAVSRLSMPQFEARIHPLKAGGSTDLGAGMWLGSQQFKGLTELSGYEYENRMIVLTDAQPNTGDTSASGFANITRYNADRRCYTTFIGIGVDFNTQLIEQITKIKGANYYSVHSPRQFRERVENEFDYMVTPIVFNVGLSFQSETWQIERVFGSPEADAATGNLMHINTLFAAKSEGGENRGGIVLLKLRRVASGPDKGVYLRTTYEDRNGRVDGDESVVHPLATSPEYFPNSGIRKGVLLTRYAALLKNWMIDERQYRGYGDSWNASVREDCGIVIPNENAGQWERTSTSLTVSQPYRSIFRDFAGYFEDEIRAIGDNSLQKELDVLDRLAGSSSSGSIRY